MPRCFLVRRSACSRRRPNYSKLHDSSPEFTFQQPYDQAHLLAAAIPPPEVLNPTASLPTLIWDAFLAPQAQPVGWASRLPWEIPKVVELTSLSEEDSGKGSQPPSLPLPALLSSSTSASSLEADGYAAFPGLGPLPKQLSGLSGAKDPQSRKAFNCKYCNKEYVGLGALRKHIRSHTLPYVCGTCGKAFSRAWLLQGHVRTHTGEKPYPCSHCNYTFADCSNLQAHLQTHSDVKKYQCKTCSRSFSRKPLLHTHQESGCSGDPPPTPMTASL